MKNKISSEMIKSILALLITVFLYIWSAEKLHLGIFLLDNYIFNFFILYVPTLVFFSSMFLTLDDVFKEVQRIIAYSFVPILAFRIGWYGYSFYFSFVVCYVLSNIVFPKFSKRYPIIIFNGIALILFLIWRV
ncbi:MAG: hypothetical protein ACPL3B_07755 [Fervidobacterium sp.]